MVRIRFGVFIVLDLDPHSSNFVDPNPDPHHWIKLYFLFLQIRTSWKQLNFYLTLAFNYGGAQLPRLFTWEENGSPEDQDRSHPVQRSEGILNRRISFNTGPWWVNVFYIVHILRNLVKTFGAVSTFLSILDQENIFSAKRKTLIYIYVLKVCRQYSDNILEEEAPT